MLDRSATRKRPGASGLLGILCVLGCAACVHNPQGYQTLSQEDPWVIHATPWKMYGIAPTHWTLADGQKARVDVGSYTISSGFGLYRSDMEFDVSWDGSGLNLHCETEPSGPDVPETRFGCWSKDDGGKRVRFWMAPNAHCGFRDLEVPATLTEPACWTGVLTTPSDSYAVEFGHLSRIGSPVGRISWTGSSGKVELAADIVVDTIIRLFPGGLRQEVDEALILQTIALHWYWHASDPD